METITDKEFHELVQFVHRHYGINLSQKRSLVVSRLQPYLDKNDFPTLTAFLEHVATDRNGRAGSILINKLATNHTYFWREPKHFLFLKQHVFPWLAEKEAQGKDIRIWSAGCSSGEEAYTLAMAIDDFWGPEKWRWDTKILATDISSDVLERAQQAVYFNSQMEELPSVWYTKYFRKLDAERSKVVDQIRSEVVFRRLNLMNEVFPFKKQFHIIFCRNVMIYFDAPTKQRLIRRFYDNLQPGGFLFIGHSEGIDRRDCAFNLIAPAIYRKDAR